MHQVIASDLNPLDFGMDAEICHMPDQEIMNLRAGIGLADEKPLALQIAPFDQARS